MHRCEGSKNVKIGQSAAKLRIEESSTTIESIRKE